MESAIRERIKQVFRRKNVTVNSVCIRLGLKQKTLNNQINGTSAVGIGTILAIIGLYDDVSLEWLLTGEGEMLKSIPNKNSTTNIDYKNKREGVLQRVTAGSDNAGIPLIPVNAMAGFLTGEIQVLEYECERYIVPIFREADFLIQVKGSSMIPKYNSGDLVACKKLSLNDLFFQWNKVYVLDTDQGALVKRIKKGPDDDHIAVVSDNKEYDTFPLHKSKIYAVALVVGVIRLE